MNSKDLEEKVINLTETYKSNFIRNFFKKSVPIYMKINFKKFGKVKTKGVINCFLNWLQYDYNLICPLCNLVNIKDEEESQILNTIIIEFKDYIEVHEDYIRYKDSTELTERKLVSELLGRLIKAKKSKIHFIYFNDKNE